MPRIPAWVTVVGAVLAGCAIGYFDSQPTWDDTGITVGAVVLSALVLSAMQPRRAWLVGLGVGLPVLLLNARASGSYASIAAVGFAMLGAGVGYLIGGGSEAGK